MAVQYSIQKKVHCCYIESIKKGKIYGPISADRICVEYRSVDNYEDVYKLYFISRNGRRKIGGEGKVKDERLSGLQHYYEEKIIQIVTENNIVFHESVFHVFSHWDELLYGKRIILDNGKIEIDDSENPVSYNNVMLYTTPILHSSEDEYIQDYVTKSFLCKTDESVQRLLEERKKEREREKEMIKKLEVERKNSIIIANSYPNAPSNDDEESIMYAIRNGYGDYVGL